jgi:hypothetical protein
MDRTPEDANPEERRLQGLIDLGLIDARREPDDDDPIIEPTPPGIVWAQEILDMARPDLCEHCGDVISDGLNTLEDIAADPRLPHGTVLMLMAAIGAGSAALYALVPDRQRAEFVERQAQRRYAQGAANRVSPN